MAKVSTADCKQLLVDLFTANHELREFFDLNANTALADLKQVLNVAHWKRVFKVNAVQGKDVDDFGELPDRFMIFTPQSSVNRFGETSTFEPISNFKVVRGFDCEPAEGQIRYLVLERHDGTIVVGDYFGD